MKKVMISLPKDLHEKAKIYVKNNGMSLSGLIKVLLEKEL